MLKKAFFAVPLVLAALTIISFTAENRKPVKTIIIDAGHGGADQGAEGLFSTEAQLTLILAKKLGVRINEEVPGVKVLFTRTTDIFPGNVPTKKEGDRYRASFANSSKADLFISIHCNSAGRSPGGWNERRIVGYDEKISYTGKKKKKKVVTKIPVYESYYVTNQSKGTETFIWAARENSHKEQLVGSTGEFAANGEDSTAVVEENDPVINALKLLYTKKYFLNSLKLAELVQQEFVKTGRINRGVKQRNDVGIWVLHATGMPSILVEAGFISNKEEEEYMNSEAGQNEITKNITDAVKLYINAVNNPKKGPDNETTATSNSAAAILHQRSKKTVSV
ncbi:MAG TPA: N-acetylmuramoyl-L-alanine amidase [Flavisolibacter sp.]|nr:N-acetylmuramoyl-L-alanine amidase [Flavisolibacter sp.]